MATAGGKGGGARKYGQQKRSPADAAQAIRTNANKMRRKQRQDALAARPDSAVSKNCLNSRRKRRNKKQRATR